jgi:hypothetical protein
LNNDDIAAPFSGASLGDEADLHNVVTQIMSARWRHLMKAHQNRGQQL